MINCEKFVMMGSKKKRMPEYCTSSKIIHEFQHTKQTASDHPYWNYDGGSLERMERALVRLKAQCHDGTLHDCPVIDELMS